MVVLPRFVFTELKSRKSESNENKSVVLRLLAVILATDDIIH